MTGYPGLSWGGADCPFHLIEGAIGFLLVDARSDLIIAKKPYGDTTESHERALHQMCQLAALLNYGTLELNHKVLKAIDLTA